MTLDGSDIWWLLLTNKRRELVENTNLEHEFTGKLVSLADFCETCRLF
jgi:hypothetical protein